MNQNVKGIISSFQQQCDEAKYIEAIDRLIDYYCHVKIAPVYTLDLLIKKLRCPEFLKLIKSEGIYLDKYDALIGNLLSNKFSRGNPNDNINIEHIKTLEQDIISYLEQFLVFNIKFIETKNDDDPDLNGKITITMFDGLKDNIKYNNDKYLSNDTIKVIREQLKSIKLLLKNKINPNVDGKSPLYLILDFLLGFNKVCRRDNFENGKSIISLVEKEVFEIIKILADNGANIKYIHYNQSIFEIIIRSGNLNLVDFLLITFPTIQINVANIHYDSTIITPLQLALKKGFTNICELLISKGADINLNGGITILDTAIRIYVDESRDEWLFIKYRNLIEKLLESGAEMNINIYRKLLKLTAKKHIELMKEVLLQTENPIFAFEKGAAFLDFITECYDYYLINFEDSTSPFLKPFKLDGTVEEIYKNTGDHYFWNEQYYLYNRYDYVTKYDHDSCNNLKYVILYLIYRKIRWSFKIHVYFSKEAKDSIFTFLLINKYGKLPHLPLEILFEIFSNFTCIDRDMPLEKLLKLHNIVQESREKIHYDVKKEDSLNDSDDSEYAATYEYGYDYNCDNDSIYYPSDDSDDDNGEYWRKLDPVAYDYARCFNNSESDDDYS